MECESVVEECPRGVPEKRRGSGECESVEKDRTVVQGEGEAGGRRTELADEAHEDCAW